MIPSDSLEEAAPLATHVLARYQAALEVRAEWCPLWQECYRYALPEQALFFGIGGSLRRARDDLFDATAADAAEQLSASLLGYLTPPWVNWFSFAAGPNAPEDRRAALLSVLAHATRTVQGQMDQSALTTELHQSMLDMVVGGTGCLYITENPIGAFVPFAVRSVPLHELVLSEDENGALSNVYRPRRVTRAVAMTLCDAGDMLGAQGLDLLSSLPDKELDILEFSEYDGRDFVTGILATPPQGDPLCIALRRTATSPFILFRWLKTPGHPYGRSPVMKALPDIKTANKVVELILKNASIAVTGIWQAEDDGVLNPANIELIPGAIIPKAVGSAGLTPLDMPARFDVSQLVLDDLRARIRHALMADRFAQFDGRRMTATEVAERTDEITLLMGAIYGRLQTELLTPLLVRLYDILRARGDIADLPIDNRVVQIIYQSPLARAQAARGAAPILAFMDQAMRLGSTAAAEINMPETVRYLAEAWGVPETLLTLPTPLAPLAPLAPLSLSTPSTPSTPLTGE